MQSISLVCVHDVDNPRAAVLLRACTHARPSHNARRTNKESAVKHEEWDFQNK